MHHFKEGGQEARGRREQGGREEAREGGFKVFRVSDSNIRLKERVRKDGLTIIIIRFITALLLLLFIISREREGPLGFRV